MIRLITVSEPCNSNVVAEARPQWYVTWQYDGDEDKAVRLEQAMISLRALMSDKEGVPL